MEYLNIEKLKNNMTKLQRIRVNQLKDNIKYNVKNN